MPEEILENFKLVVNENKLEECENNAYPKLSSYLMTGGCDETVILGSINQIYFPDRELKTPLHRLLALKKFEILHKLHKKELESKSKNYDKVLTQLEYIYDNHFKYSKDDLESVFTEFDYLFNDEDSENLDRETHESMEYFVSELKNISHKLEFMRV